MDSAAPDGTADSKRERTKVIQRILLQKQVSVLLHVYNVRYNYDVEVHLISRSNQQRSDPITKILIRDICFCNYALQL